jgi:hypothetical protein
LFVFLEGGGKSLPAKSRSGWLNLSFLQEKRYERSCQQSQGCICLKDLFTEEKLQYKVQWAAEQFRKLDLTTGGKGAAQVLDALVGVGKALPYVGAAIAIGLLVFNLGSDDKSPEMLMLRKYRSKINI